MRVARFVAAGLLLLVIAGQAVAQSVVGVCIPFMPNYQPCDRSGVVQCSAFWPHGDTFTISVPPCDPRSQIRRQIDADLRAMRDDVNNAVFSSELQTLRYLLMNLGESGVAFWVVMKNTSDKPVSFRLAVLIGSSAHGNELRAPNAINGEQFLPPAQLYADLARDYPGQVPKSAWRSEYVDLQPNEVSTREFKYDWARTRGLNGIHVLALFKEGAMGHPALDPNDVLAIGAQEFHYTPPLPVSRQSGQQPHR